MSEKNIIPASAGIVPEVKALIKERKNTRRKFTLAEKKLGSKAKRLAGAAKSASIVPAVKTLVKGRKNTRSEFTLAEKKLGSKAKRLAKTAKGKEGVRRKLAVTAGKLKSKAKRLATTAKGKEGVRRKLAVLAEKLRLKNKKLAVTAKEKEKIRKKLVVTDKKLAVVAKEKEGVRRKLVVTDKKLALAAKEKESIRLELFEHAKGLEESRLAMLNLLEDLQIEKDALTHAKAKDEALLQSIGDGVVAIDKDGKIILVNRAAEQMLGQKTDELFGKFLFDAWKALDEKENVVPEAERPINIAFRGKTTVTTTTGPSYFYTRKDGTKFPVAITVTPVVANNKIIGAIDVFRDISKEKEVDKAKTEFVSLASHQLRTPLTTVSWCTEMILNGDVGKVIPGQKKYLEEIYRGNHRMIELVNTLLDVSRLELGTIKVEPKPTNVIALAQSVIDEQKPKIKEKKHIIIQKFSKDIPIYSTDPKLLRMVFQNLLANSVEYTPQGGKIELAISFLPAQAGAKEKEEIRIKISDTGYGIPKNQQHKIFTKLFRADNVRNKDTDGTGLGLYIVKSIVENFGGKIWFESEENKGTTFYITLPFSEMENKKGSKTVDEEKI